MYPGLIFHGLTGEEGGQPTCDVPHCVLPKFNGLPHLLFAHVLGGALSYVEHRCADHQQDRDSQTPNDDVLIEMPFFRGN